MDKKITLVFEENYGLKNLEEFQNIVERMLIKNIKSVIFDIDNLERGEFLNSALKIC